MHSSLALLDWLVIAAYVAFAFSVGALFTRRASTGVKSFFVGDRAFPWWLAGTSIVATSFASDTPLAVTGIVANNGISGNWVWWCWGTAHLASTFLFARMWRRSEVITDAQITELRYGGRAAAVLRGVKAVYFGLFINCLTMAWVISAMVKISQALFEVQPAVVIVACIVASVGYTTLGGFRSVVVTDMVQLALGLGGAVLLAWLAADRFGGLGALPGADGSGGAGLLGAVEQAAREAGRAVDNLLAFAPPADNPRMSRVYFVVLLVAGWWRLAEGNGYLVQRLASCKDEGHAQGAALWFSMAHNAIRPWPWILVALAALVIFPVFDGAAPAELRSRSGRITVRPAQLDVVRGGTLTMQGPVSGGWARVLGQEVPLRWQDGAPRATFGAFVQGGKTQLIIRSQNIERGRTIRVPGLRVGLGDRETAYPLLMVLLLPAGLLGLVVASLLAAFMSTIDTHTNWGASYLVQDLYRRFLRPEAGERHCVRVSRLCIVLMAILAGVTALYVQSIAAVWRFMITLGAGLGSVTATRWFWHRVTPQAELAAMGVTTALSLALQLLASPTLAGADNPLFVMAVPPWAQIVIIAACSLATWIPVALWGPQNDPRTLQAFADKVRPPGPGWAHYNAGADPLAPSMLRLGAGMVAVYGTLFGIGYVLLGHPLGGGALLVLAGVMLAWVIRSGRGA